MKNLFFYFAFCLFVVSSCKKNVDTPNSSLPGQPQNVTVHIAGYEYVGDKSFARYWKNGVVETLPDNGDSHDASASAIVVSGSDVYIAGVDSWGGFSGSAYARYWKNKTPVDLNDGSEFAVSSGIAISGNDIYISGVVGNDAMYWKNGVRYLLDRPDSAIVSSANGIAVSGNDVYIAGSEYFPAGLSVAKYWKNGASVRVNDSLESSFTTSIFIAGNDVYMAGVGYANGLNGNSHAKYWKNGAPVNLGDPTLNGVANSIFVSGSDVYVAGFQADGTGGYAAKYWKNGVPVVLTTSGNGIASSIFVSGNDVYVAGSINSYAVYWKNGHTIELDRGSASSSGASSIFVTSL